MKDGCRYSNGFALTTSSEGTDLQLKEQIESEGLEYTIMVCFKRKRQRLAGKVDEAHVNDRTFIQLDLRRNVATACSNHSLRPTYRVERQHSFAL